jgi:hypothetical protein
VLRGTVLRPDLFFSASRPQKSRMLRQVCECIRYTPSVPDVALVALLMAIIGTFGYNFSVFIPLITRYLLRAGAAAFRR